MAPTPHPHIPPPMAPTSHPHVPPLVDTTQQPHAGHEQGNTKKKIQLTKPGVFEMRHGERIIVPFDRQLRAYGEATSLLSSTCGRITTNSNNVLINLDSWPKVPKSYKDDCFNILKVHVESAERYCSLCMSNKYRNEKMNLWNRVYDTSLSREQLIANVPDGIQKDQWSSFVDYHLSEEYKKLSKRNIEVRKAQKIPHTGGAKLLSTKQHEMVIILNLGRAVGRGELYIETHKKRNESYVNEEARSIAEKMTQEMSQSVNSNEISVDDCVSKVLGKDHSGRVCCLGLGGLHSVAFQSKTRFSNAGHNFSNSGSVESSQLKEEVICLKEKLLTSEENLKTLKSVTVAYIQMKEGHIPHELGVMFGNESNVISGQELPTSRGGSSLDSNFHGV
ncbi:putative transposase [Vigna unguiculata]|uniref:Putative transposase n=1 Tax=Vigna unguiculata TaxID=3917 RepID=A0A4D6M2Z7_VIGUN|nr:putative transposase [Vigna unguiculata]